MMQAYEVVGYAYEADLHCPDCARKRFGKALENGAVDREGNEVYPLFASDFTGDAENCCDCAAPIFDAEEGDCDCDDCEDCQDEQIIYFCRDCGMEVFEDQAVWIDPVTGEATVYGNPYHVECAPPQHK